MNFLDNDDSYTFVRFEWPEQQRRVFAALCKNDDEVLASSLLPIETFQYYISFCSTEYALKANVVDNSHCSPIRRFGYSLPW